MCSCWFYFFLKLVAGDFGHLWREGWAVKWVWNMRNKLDLQFSVRRRACDMMDIYWDSRELWKLHHSQKMMPMMMMMWNGNFIRNRFWADCGTNKKEIIIGNRTDLIIPMSLLWFIPNKKKRTLSSSFSFFLTSSIMREVEENSLVYGEIFCGRDAVQAHVWAHQSMEFVQFKIMLHFHTEIHLLRVHSSYIPCQLSRVSADVMWEKKFKSKNSPLLCFPCCCVKKSHKNETSSGKVSKLRATRTCAPMRELSLITSTFSH